MRISIETLIGTTNTLLETVLVYTESRDFNKASVSTPSHPTTVTFPDLFVGSEADNSSILKDQTLGL